MKNFIRYALVLSIVGTDIANAETSSPSASDRYVYVGTEFGLSDPIKKLSESVTNSTIEVY